MKIFNEYMKMDFIKEYMTKKYLKIIVLLFYIYFMVFLIDITFTSHNINKENNPISLFFISIFGYPINLFIPYVCICIPLMFKKTWDKIRTNKYVFFLFYVILFVFIIGHVKGIITWL